MVKLNEMTIILIKMSVQCSDFLPYSASTVTISALYSATAFLKHSKEYQSPEVAWLVNELRKITTQIVNEELRQHETFMGQLDCDSSEVEMLEERLDLYQRQFQQRFIEQIAMDLVEFYNAFDSWHCGLNQLKKFTKVPFWF